MLTLLSGKALRPYSKIILMVSGKSCIVPSTAVLPKTCIMTGVMSENSMTAIVPGVSPSLNIARRKSALDHPAIIHFVFFQGCRTAEPARQALDQAIKELALDCRVIEIDTTDGLSGAAMGRYPSPTILVNGRELFGPSQGSGACCRVYPAGSLEPAVLAAELGAALGLA